MQVSPEELLQDLQNRGRRIQGTLKSQFSTKQKRPLSQNECIVELQ